MLVHVYPAWPFDGFGSEPLYIVRGDARFGGDYEPMTTGAAVGWLRRWMLDDRAHAQLSSVHQNLFGPLPLEIWSARDLHERLDAALATALERRDILILEPTRSGRGIVPVDPVDPVDPNKPPIKPKQETTFIEIELLDAAGVRFPTRLRLHMADGSVREPAFDGFVHLDDVPAGTCEVELPEVDGREWGASPGGPGTGVREGTPRTIARGDCTSSLARQNSFASWRTIWEDPLNADLAKKRKNPNLLAVGDALVIPKREDHTEFAPTGKRSTYRVLGERTRLKIAYAGTSVNDYVLRVGGQTFQGKVAPNGMIDELIPADATGGELELRSALSPERVERWTIALGALDPIEDLIGVQERLENLGFPCPIDGKDGPDTQSAVKAYQSWRGLPATGKVDDATRADLQAVHDAG